MILILCVFKVFNKCYLENSNNIAFDWKLITIQRVSYFQRAILQISRIQYTDISSITWESTLIDNMKYIMLSMLVKIFLKDYNSLPYECQKEPHNEISYLPALTDFFASKV